MLSIRVGKVSFNSKGKVNFDRRTLKKNDVVGHVLYAAGSVLASMGFTKLVKHIKTWFN